MSSSRLPRVGSRLELERVDPTCNARRRYALAVTCDPQLALFEGEGPAALVLVRVWGRLEGKATVRRERFEGLAALRARWRELVARRRRHGYVEVPRRSVRRG